MVRQSDIGKARQLMRLRAEEMTLRVRIQQHKERRAAIKAQIGAIRGPRRKPQGA